MTIDFRTLCVELTDCLEKADWPNRYKVVFQQWTDIARAALAEPDEPAVPEGREPTAVVGEPSDRELLELMPQQFRDDLATVSRLASYGTPVEPGIYRVSLNTGALDFARAAIALDRSRRAPGQPAEGEVEELVADELVRRLRTKAATEKSNRCHYSAILLTRAADLLSIAYATGPEVWEPIPLLPGHHPAPVPVSERLPEPEDCTAQGWCWVFYRGFADWTLEPPLGQDGKHTGYTHWLPAHALPLPAGGPQP